MPLTPSKALLAAACSALCLSALPAAAQFAKAEDAIGYRQAAYTLMATHFGRIGAMVQGKAPWDAQAAAANMAVLRSVHALPYPAFVAGSDKGETGALPAVWAKPDEFKAANDKLLAAMAKLDTAVASGSLDATKAAFGPTGGSCKGCHDDFRRK